MGTELDSILERVEKADAAVADQLRAYLARNQQREFGLVFKRHLPERVSLPGRRISPGDKVAVLASRGQTAPAVPDNGSWILQERAGDQSLLRHTETGEIASVPSADVVYASDFNDPIYPGLRSLGSICNSTSNRPTHTVINGENFHTLQALRYTHAGKVDLIYIDPPYNTGGKTSWLYNDKYVDATDGDKHSKWLAFMERRLAIARTLLKPSGAIMVSIGDDEQHRLRMLMDQVFGEGNQVANLAVEMSTTSGPKTVNAQQGTIVKNVEYVLIYRNGPAFDIEIRHTPLYDGIDQWDSNYPLLLNDNGTTEALMDHLDAEPAIRADIEKFALTKPNGQFIGASAMDLLLRVSSSAKQFVLDNLTKIGRTDTAPVTARDMVVEPGYWVWLDTPARRYRITRSSTGKVWQVYTLDQNYRQSDDYRTTFGRTVIRGDLWRGFHSDMAHVSSEGGVVFKNGKKPVRLIQQLIRWANNSPDAVILDFFGGSGSTTHAVMAMNEADGGNRQSILVTNNEVGVESAKKLARDGRRAGDREWEVEGVFESVTKPRLETVASGTRPDGSICSDGLLTNLEFFELTYENPTLIELDLAFARVAPLLWLAAGGTGSRINKQHSQGWDVADRYAVVFHPDKAVGLVGQLTGKGTAYPGVRTVFIVTDDQGQFQTVARQLPEHIRTQRLYSSYLHSFTINASHQAN